MAEQEKKQAATAKKAPVKKVGLKGMKKPAPPKDAAGFEDAPDISKTGNYFIAGKYENG